MRNIMLHPIDYLRNQCVSELESAIVLYNAVEQRMGILSRVSKEMKHTSYERVEQARYEAHGLKVSLQAFLRAIERV